MASLSGRLRVLVASADWFPDLKGGNARVATETARALAARGHDVHVLARRLPGLPELEREGGLTVERTLPRTFLPVTVTDVLAAYRRAARIAGRFDVVLSHASTLSYGLLAAELPAPVVAVFHAPVARELRFDAGTMRLGPRRAARSLVAMPLARIERAAIGRAAAVLVLSEYTRSLLLADHPRAEPRVLRVSGGVDTQRFSPSTAEGRNETPLLLTVRRLEPRMGIENLLVAVAGLRRRRPVELAIVGGGSLRAELELRAAELGIASSVRFLGTVGEDELLAWYRRADLFVLPTVAYEGFGMVTAEALACGTPVVGTPVGATPELLAPLDPRLVAGGADAADLEQTVAAALDLLGPSL
ncbi:MAG TPA: glycosyltransferase family 4 protein, partial [Gaiellaceae bacterium]|nr:glycosyltransferase family 4 protein [Gaiellaceae bacterium]